MTLVAWLLLAVPVAFGLVRLGTTGDDWRYLVVALASSLIALGTLKWPPLTGAPSAGRALGAGAAAAFCAAVTAALLGARNGPAIAMVSLGFALCSATGAVLRARSRHAPLS